MPTYEYICKQHGPFTEMAPLAKHASPQPCPTCGKSSERNLLSTPQISGKNTRPKAKQPSPQGRKVKHAPGCPCCS